MVAGAVLCSTPRMHGFGMVELMVALLIFSLGLAGARSAQHLARQAAFESLQVTQASIYARDMLERIMSNPGAASTYIEAAGQWDGKFADSDSDSDQEYGACEIKTCSAQQRAKSDVLHWHASMLGSSTVLGEQWLFGLPDVKACIEHIGKLIEVRVSWAVANAPRLRPELGCLEQSEGTPPLGQSRVQVRFSALIHTSVDTE